MTLTVFSPRDASQHGHGHLEYQRGKHHETDENSRL